MNPPTLPVGAPVEPVSRVETPARTRYEGQFVALAPLDPASDLQDLYACSHGSPACEHLWTYMGYGPFRDAADMAEWLNKIALSSDPLFFAVLDRPSGRRVGMVSFLNIVPDARRLELGHIWYAPEAQRTKVNTEAVHLMLCESFDRLGYRRVEWKCDALNARSRAAALRLGFQFEGIFRQHLIVKGRNRDTAWFSILDREWPAVRKNAETWLYHNPDGRRSLGQRNGGPA